MTLTKRNPIVEVFGGRLLITPDPYGPGTIRWCDGTAEPRMRVLKDYRTAEDHAGKLNGARLLDVNSNRPEGEAWMVNIGGTILEPAVTPVGAYNRSAEHYGGLAGVEWHPEDWPEISRKAQSLGWSPPGKS